MTPLVKGVLVLDTDGHRVFAKYYDNKLALLQTQLEFERGLLTKVSRTSARMDGRKYSKLIV
jgi:hypothetical protein